MGRSNKNNIQDKSYKGLFSKAIFLLDQNIDRIEFYDRLKDIVIGFNKINSVTKSQNSCNVGFGLCKSAFGTI